jgi:hypothetical protein
LIVGYALPGRPIAMMMFKTWLEYSHFHMCMPLNQMLQGLYHHGSRYLRPVNTRAVFLRMTALTFTSDFKLGHYMKIPPRQMFWSQVSAQHSQLPDYLRGAVRSWQPLFLVPSSWGSKPGCSPISSK